MEGTKNGCGHENDIGWTRGSRSGIRAVLAELDNVRAGMSSLVQPCSRDCDRRGDRGFNSLRVSALEHESCVDDEATERLHESD